ALRPLRNCSMKSKVNLTLSAGEDPSVAQSVFRSNQTPVTAGWYRIVFAADCTPPFTAVRLHPNIGGGFSSEHFTKFAIRSGLRQSLLIRLPAPLVSVGVGCSPTVSHFSVKEFWLEPLSWFGVLLSLFKHYILILANEPNIAPIALSRGYSKVKRTGIVHF